MPRQRPSRAPAIAIAIASSCAAAPVIAKGCEFLDKLCLIQDHNRKLRRGCQDGRGNVIDWMVGATVNTGDYIGENKDQLGSAGGAGAGVMVGTMLGGPVGAVIGGVIGGVTSGTAIRQIDKRIKNAMNKRDSKYEEKRLKPGQLALSP